MTAEPLDIEANQPSSLLTTEVRRFHTIPPRKLPLLDHQVKLTHHTPEFDRASLVASMREALDRRETSEPHYYNFLFDVPLHFFNLNAFPCAEELRLWFLMTTDPRTIDYNHRDTSWVEDIDCQADIRREDAFEHLFSHYRRLEVKYGDLATYASPLNSLVTFPFFAISRLYALEDVLEAAMASAYAPLLIRHEAFRWNKHQNLAGEAKRRATETMANAIEAHIVNSDVDIAIWENLVAMFPSPKGLRLVLERFDGLENIHHHGSTFVRLMRLIEDREAFDWFVYKSNARVLFQPACAYAQIARFGLEEPDEMLTAIAQKLGYKWGREHWSMIFHLHAPEVTELILVLLAGEITPIDRMAPKARRWLRREGANAVETLIKHALDESSEYQQVATETIAYYISRGHSELVESHLGAEKMKTMGLTNEDDIQVPTPTLQLSRELEDHELPEWLARWSKRGLIAPYPPQIHEQWFIPLENEDGEYLSQRAMFGVMRLFQEATRRPREEVDLLRSSFTQHSRELLAASLESLWFAQNAPGKYRWLITAGALLGQDGTLEFLRGELHHRPKGITSYYHHVEQPRWVTHSLASLPGKEGLRLLFEDWMWRRKQRYPAHWKDSALERAAKERGVSYFALIESMLPELGIARNGKCHFELDGITFRYELDHDDHVLLSDRLEDGSWRELSIYHPNTTHAQARRAAKQEGSRLLELYSKLLVDVIEQGTTWNAFEWFQGLNHPVYRSCRRRVLWRILSKDRKHMKDVRVCEDGSLSDIHDDPVSLPTGCFVQPAKWQELGDRALVAWSTLFADHEVVALGR